MILLRGPPRTPHRDLGPFYFHFGLPIEVIKKVKNQLFLAKSWYSWYVYAKYRWVKNTWWKCYSRGAGSNVIRSCDNSGHRNSLQWYKLVVAIYWILAVFIRPLFVRGCTHPSSSFSFLYFYKNIAFCYMYIIWFSKLTLLHWEESKTNWDFITKVL